MTRKTGSQNIFLIGLMGAGKTTVGRHLAKRLGKTFIDADHELEARCGVKIAHIFDVEGETGFRRREAGLLTELAKQSNIVLATGGGAVISPENRAVLSENGTVVYLCASAAQLARRMRNDKKRPLLQNGDTETILESLYSARDPWYREIADVTINSTRHPARRIVNRLIAKLTEHVVGLTDLADQTDHPRDSVNEQTHDHPDD